MPIVQNLKTGNTYEVSRNLVESSEVLKLMIGDTIAEEAEEPIPMTIDIQTIKALNDTLNKLESIKIKKK